MLGRESGGVYSGPRIRLRQPRSFQAQLLAACRRRRQPRTHDRRDGHPADRALRRSWAAFVMLLHVHVTLRVSGGDVARRRR